MTLMVRSEDPPPYYGGIESLPEDEVAEARRALAEIDRAPSADARVLAMHWVFLRVREQERQRIAGRLFGP